MTLEPHHAAARLRTPDEDRALAVVDKLTRRSVLARLHPDADAATRARAEAVAAHFGADREGGD